MVVTSNVHRHPIHSSVDWTLFQPSSVDVNFSLLRGQLTDDKLTVEYSTIIKSAPCWTCQTPNAAPCTFQHLSPESAIVWPPSDNSKHIRAINQADPYSAWNPASELFWWSGSRITPTFRNSLWYRWIHKWTTRWKYKLAVSNCMHRFQSRLLRMAGPVFHRVLFDWLTIMLASNGAICWVWKWSTYGFYCRISKVWYFEIFAFRNVEPCFAMAVFLWTSFFTAYMMFMWKNWSMNVWMKRHAFNYFEVQMKESHKMRTCIQS